MSAWDYLQKVVKIKWDGAFVKEVKIIKNGIIKCMCLEKTRKYKFSYEENDT